MYMYVAKASKGELVEIYVSTILHGFTNFEKAKLPEDALLSKTFTIMDSSEQSVFLYV